MKTLTIVLSLVALTPAQQVRFVAMDVYADSEGKGLAAWQIETDGDGVMPARREREPELHNNGLTVDAGLFKAPTLRNIAVTAPYMHDGSIATLDAVLDAYAAGGRAHPNKSPIVRGFTLTADQKRDLIAFLNSLTDEALLHDPAFSNPWTTAQEEAR